MYFKDITIRDYGPISCLNYHFRFGKETGSPLPVVFAGKNGSGKTLLLSSFADSLIEVKRSVFGDKNNDVSGNNLFKKVGRGYIKNGQKCSKIFVSLTQQNLSMLYYSVALLDGQPYQKEPVPGFYDAAESECSSVPGLLFTKLANGSGKLDKAKYESEINLYFPSDRYYEPSWKNVHRDVSSQYFDDKNIIDMSFNHVIHNDVFEGLYTWLIDVFLETEFFVSQDQGNIIKTRRINPLQKSIFALLELIKENAGINPFPSRNRKMLSITWKGGILSDITQLSTGEAFVFSIGATLLKEWDTTHSKMIASPKEIRGTLIVDEADVGMNMDFLYVAWPKLLRMFPNVQFVLSAQSPFLVDSLRKEFGGDIDVVSLPSGDVISDVSMFDEAMKAYEAINEKTADLVNENSKFKLRIEVLEKAKKAKFLLVEGKSDEIILNKAALALGSHVLDDFCIVPCGGVSKVLSYLDMVGRLPTDSLFVGMIDRDAEDETKKLPFAKAVYGNEFINVDDSKTVFLFGLPIPDGRSAFGDEISIEHYFSDSEIKTEIGGRRLYFYNEFTRAGVLSSNHELLCKKTTQHKNHIRILSEDQNTCICDSNGNKVDMLLTKDAFAEAVANSKIGTVPSSFSQFQKIFDLLGRICIK